MKKKINFKKFIKHFLYNGLEKESFAELLPDIVSENNRMMEILATIMTVVGWVVSIASYFGIVLDRRSFPACLFLYITSAFFLLIRRYSKLNNNTVSHIIGVIQLITLHLFAILISTFFASNPNTNGVIYHVMLLSSPFVFLAEPVKMDTLLCCSVTFYLHYARLYKMPEAYYYDRIFAYIILFITILCNWFFVIKSVKNISNKKYIEKERDTDALTGLLTKQAGKSLTINKLDNNEKGVLFIIDMDNFKHINDTQGHLYGDDILIRLSNIMKENTRRIDVVSRFGGDEFVIFFPGMEKDEIAFKARSILELVKQRFKNETFKISCSIGAAFADGEIGYNTLFEKADNALYEAKKLGKNTFFYEKEKSA